MRFKLKRIKISTKRKQKPKEKGWKWKKKTLLTLIEGWNYKQLNLYKRLMKKTRNHKIKDLNTHNIIKKKLLFKKKD